MDTRFKTFGLFTELNWKEQYMFEEFRGLNDCIEKNNITSFQEVYNSYIKILLDTGGENNIDFSKYSELDFQIKYLIEELNISVNKIIIFAEFKFAFIKDKIIGLLGKLYNLTNSEKQEFLNVMFQMRKGTMFFKVIDKNKKVVEIHKVLFIIDGDFSNDYVKILKKISSINVIKTQETYGKVYVDVSMQKINT